MLQLWLHANLPHEVPRFQPRIRYRIVFNELGKTIHSLRHLSDVSQCLFDATRGAFPGFVTVPPNNLPPALEIRHKLGYVHCDVNAGNISLCKSAGMPSDAESAKTTDLTIYEVRTVCSLHLSCPISSFITCNKGTNQFEPIEVRQSTTTSCCLPSSLTAFTV